MRRSLFARGRAAGRSDPRPGSGDRSLLIPILYACSADDEVAEEGGEAGATFGESGEVCLSDLVSVPGGGVVFEEPES